MKKRGFTLVELIVSLGIFAIVMTLAAGGYLLIISVNREAQTLATGVNNLSYVLEYMARTVRTGTQYYCNAPATYMQLSGTQDCLATPGTSLGVIDQNGNPQIFSLSGGAINKNGTRITDTAITVDKLNFYVRGSAPQSSGFSGSTVQPMVFIVIQGTVSAGAGKPSRTFNMQTTALMRVTDL
jgi:prepilin-type N-terminal cleavage/methylation domain-containing protein